MSARIPRKIDIYDTIMNIKLSSQTFHFRWNREALKPHNMKEYDQQAQCGTYSVHCPIFMVVLCFIQIFVSLVRSFVFMWLLTNINIINFPFTLVGVPQLQSCEWGMDFQNILAFNIKPFFLARFGYTWRSEFSWEFWSLRDNYTFQHLLIQTLSFKKIVPHIELFEISIFVPFFKNLILSMLTIQKIFYGPFLR